jgi:hypothetical protein
MKSMRAALPGSPDGRSGIPRYQADSRMNSTIRGLTCVKAGIPNMMASGWVAIAISKDRSQSDRIGNESSSNQIIHSVSIGRSWNMRRIMAGFPKFALVPITKNLSRGRSSRSTSDCMPLKPNLQRIESGAESVHRLKKREICVSSGLYTRTHPIYLENASSAKFLEKVDLVTSGDVQFDALEIFPRQSYSGSNSMS